jgi:hypothetical protein
VCTAGIRCLIKQKRLSGPSRLNFDVSREFGLSSHVIQNVIRVVSTEHDIEDYIGERRVVETRERESSLNRTVVLK